MGEGILQLAREKANRAAGMSRTRIGYGLLAELLTCATHGAQVF